MKKCKIIISLVLIFAIFFSFCVFPSHAVVAEAVAGTFLSWLGDYVGGKLMEDMLGEPDGPLYDYFTGLLNRGASKVDDPVDLDCNHNWEYVRGGGFTGSTSSFYRCKKCGQTMTLDSDNMRDAYKDYVNDLPASGYNSAGHLIWQPSVGDVSDSSVHVGSSSYIEYSPPHNESFSNYSLSVDFNSKGNGFSYNYSFSSPAKYVANLICYMNFSFPFSGYYRIISCPKSDGYTIFSDHTVNFSYDFLPGSFSYVSVDKPIRVLYDRCYSSEELSWIGYLLNVYFPVYEVIPDSNFGDTYNINTRTTAITGDVYYFNNNGDAIVAESVNIFNETYNTYYNPVTQETRPAGAWTYDYNDRSYTCECEDGTTTTITYGDEYITIQEGDTVYNIYYYSNDTQTPEPSPSPSPSPTPGPVDPDDPNGGDDGDNGILAWLKEFKIWLGEKLDALTGGGGDDVTNIDITNNSTDIDITFTDEDGEEQKTSILGILAAFGWWKQVVEIGKEMIAEVSAAEAAAYAYDARAGGNPSGAPSIPINLASAQSVHGVNYGAEDIEMLDLSWYTPYKQTVDQLVSGFLWLFFLWALFRHAPGVISGAGLTVSRAEDVAVGKKERR